MFQIKGDQGDMIYDPCLILNWNLNKILMLMHSFKTFIHSFLNVITKCKSGRGRNERKLYIKNGKKWGREEWKKVIDQKWEINN